MAYRCVKCKKLGEDLDSVKCEPDCNALIEKIVTVHFHEKVGNTLKTVCNDKPVTKGLTSTGVAFNTTCIRCRRVLADRTNKQKENDQTKLQT